jgi:Glu-tRNA(Gln) amidotransferase subunit E-like FAD-binding protein
LGLSAVAAHRLAHTPWAALFDRVAPPAGHLARRLAASLAKRVPYHHRLGLDVPATFADALVDGMRLMDAGVIRVEALDRMVDAAIRQPETPAAELFRPFRVSEDGVVDSVIRSAVERARALPGRSAGTRVRWAMGEVMRGLVGRADPRAVEQALAGQLAAHPSEVAP